MLIRNDTPFAAMGFDHLHRDGDMMAVICARGGYTLLPDGALRIAEAQDLVLADVYEGDPQRTPLLQVGDLVPFKPATDVTVLGSAYAPKGRPARTWEVSITVGDHRAALSVHGAREWEVALGFATPTWRLGAPKPATSVPLDWRLAAGGRVIGDPDGDADRLNPIGPGILDEELTRRGRPFRAPQIDAATAPITLPFTRVEPSSFGPVPPFSAWRQRHVGTCDEAWRRERAPRLPLNFDYRFHQSAPPGLVLPRLSGDEEVRLDGLSPGGGSLSLRLPGVALVAQHTWRDGRRMSTQLSLDGLHLDLRAEPWRVDATWRGWIETCPAYEGSVLVAVRPKDAIGLPRSSELGLVVGKNIT